MQTIYAAKVAHGHRDAPINWQRERWVTPDADFVDVDWREAVTPLAEEAPLLVLFHGLEGSSSSHYATAFEAQTHGRGWHMVVPHFRGCSGATNTAPRAYHSGDHEEIDWMLTRIRAKHKGLVFAVGISLGGNALMRWAGEMGGAAGCLVDAIASVCAPVDLTASGHAIDTGFNKAVYARMFLASMKPRAMDKLQQFPGLFDAQAVMAASTLYAFDDAFTAPLHGFQNVEDYWRRASAKPVLSNVQVPALVLNARNDPFVPASCLPAHGQVSGHVTLWQPEQGGHVGFTSARFPGDLQEMPSAVMDWMTHG
ncbi:alpha/beta fold hydrolase [Limnohabitans sp.]|uniref:YheT family hydrolase n=1 Tax=Limnohabitans sp. TaxID=1907725 RepID=UPI00286F2316|nr:alpha/beta fold hydrolase [Limnohabitans sp.]